MIYYNYAHIVNNTCVLQVIILQREGSYSDACSDFQSALKTIYCGPFYTKKSSPLFFSI